MRLAVNGWRIHGRRTGVGRYLLNIVRYWDRDMVSNTIFDKVTFYSQKLLDRAGAPLPPNIDEQVLDPDCRMLLWENLRFGPTVTDDVQFCPSFSRPLIARGRTVVTSHDAVQHYHPELFPFYTRLFYSPLYGWSARNAHLAITDSEAARRDIVEGWGVDRKRVRVVYLAPAENFRPATNDPGIPGARQKHVGSSAPYFLFVGKMSGRRKIPALFEAFGEFVKRTQFPHQLVLVGMNIHNLDLVKMIHDNGIENRVSVCGYVTDEELNLLYNAADAMVMPSVYETVSLPVMEAQRVGAPVVCIGTEAMRDITGGAAELVAKLEVPALFAAMQRLAQDADYRAELSERGQENSKRFSWKKTAWETLQVLEEAAKG